MKDTMRKFQAFLANFEVNKNSLAVDTRESDRFSQVLRS